MRSNLVGLCLILVCLTACKTEPQRSVSPLPSKVALQVASPTVQNQPTVTPEMPRPAEQPVCQMPCWGSLIPGVSSEQEVKEYIDSQSREKWPQITLRTTYTGCNRYFLDNPAKWQYLLFHVNQDRLIAVEYISPDLPYLDQLVEKFGDPEYIRSVVVDNHGSDFAFMDIYYPHQGMAYQMFVKESPIGMVSENLQSNAVIYFAPGEIDQYYKSKYVCGYQNPDLLKTAVKNFIETEVRPWPGYGKMTPIRVR